MVLASQEEVESWKAKWELQQDELHANSGREGIVERQSQMISDLENQVAQANRELIALQGQVEKATVQNNDHENKIIGLL